MLRQHGQLNVAGRLQVRLHYFVLFLQLRLAAGQFDVDAMLPFLGLFAQGDVAEHAQEQRPPLLEINEAVGQLEVHRLAGAESDVAFQLCVKHLIGEMLLVNPEHRRHVLAPGVGAGEGPPHQFVGGQPDNFGIGTVDGQHDALGVGQPHAVVGILPDRAEAHFGEAQFFLRLLARRDVLHHPLVILDFAVGVAHRPRVLRYPNHRPVLAVNLRFKILHHSPLLHQLDELRPPVRVHIKQPRNVADARHQFLRGAVAVNARQRRIDIEIAPLRRGLEDARHRILKNAPVFFLRRLCRLFGLRALHRVNNRPQHQRRRQPVLHQIILRAGMDGIDRRRLIIQAA